MIIFSYFGTDVHYSIPTFEHMSIGFIQNMVVFIKKMK